MQKLFFCFFLALTTTVYAKVEFEDFLGVGEMPTPPAKQRSGSFAPVEGIDFSSKLKNRRDLRSFPPQPAQPFTTSNRLSLMSASGGVLTVWALKAGNWIWGYTPLDSISFEDARIWKIITYTNGDISFRNEKTGTCLAAYGSGVIHNFCNQYDNTQKWKFIFFKNQAVQIQNKFYPDRCLDTPDSSSAFRIYVKTCAKPGEENLSQQWYIIPPLDRTTPVFVTD